MMNAIQKIQKKLCDLEAKHRIHGMYEESDIKRVMPHRPEAYNRRKYQNEYCYPRIPYGNDKFVEMMKIVKKYAPKNATFLEVGSAFGDKVMIAQSMGFRSCGLEINSEYIDISLGMGLTKVEANSDLLADFPKVVWGDALKFRHYGKFDVIYFYSPMTGDAEQDFECRVIEAIKPLAIVVGWHGWCVRQMSQKDKETMETYNYTERKWTDEHSYSGLMAISRKKAG